jgi:hypothetical protein
MKKINLIAAGFVCLVTIFVPTNIYSQVTFQDPASVCENDPVQTDLGGATPTGGTFSGTGVTDDANGTSFTFDPATAGVGNTTVNYELIQQLGLDIDGEAGGDESGWSVSLSADGSRVAIGARFNDGTGSNAGHVRLYDFDGTSWQQVGADIDGEAGGDNSGYSVSLSADGSRVAIGASSNDGTGRLAGHVRLYDFDGTSWQQVGADIDGEAVFDFSGESVSLSADGSRVAIGALGNDGTGSNAGHVRLYDFDGTSWEQVGADIDGEAESDFFGRSVSLSADGSRVAIGAFLNNGTGTSAGHVRVFEVSSATAQIEVLPNEHIVFAEPDPICENEDPTIITPELSFTCSDATPTGGTFSGTGVTDDANGTSFTFDPATAGVGNTTVNYELIRQLGLDIDGEAAGDQSGYSVSLSADGSRVAIGARLNDATGSNAGHVRLYDFDGTSWEQVGADIDGEAGDD